MGATEYVIGAGWFVAAILTGAGFYMGPAPEDFMVARYAFIIAGVIFGATGLVWGFSTESHWAVRILVTGLMGGIAVAGVNEAIRLVAQREAPPLLIGCASLTH